MLIHGPRQSGKTTLARTVGESGGYRYVSFDDETVCRAVQEDSVGFVATFRHGPSSPRSSACRGSSAPSSSLETLYGDIGHPVETKIRG